MNLIYTILYQSNRPDWHCVLAGFCHFTLCLCSLPKKKKNYKKKGEEKKYGMGVGEDEPIKKIHSPDNTF